MTRFLTATLAVCATLALAPDAVTPSKADAENGVHYYLSLGDSLAQGAQPIGDLSFGYADQLYSALHATDSKLELIKLGCGGETTASMIDPALPTKDEGRTSSATTRTDRSSLKPSISSTRTRARSRW